MRKRNKQAASGRIYCLLLTTAPLWKFRRDAYLTTGEFFCFARPVLQITCNATSIGRGKVVVTATVTRILAVEQNPTKVVANLLVPASKYPHFPADDPYHLMIVRTWSIPRSLFELTQSKGYLQAKSNWRLLFLSVIGFGPVKDPFVWG
jgi:hypothetical protein